VFVRDALDSAPLIAEGVWQGLLLEAPLGAAGFGYDPYFWLAELGMTAAQLDLAEKNRLSHRGIAMRALRAQLASRALAPAQTPAQAQTDPVQP
jgi:XTP/dITP diphosphohydrolase